MLGLVSDVLAAEFSVTHTEDTADGACDADCSLRDAILAANAAPGKDTVLLPAGHFVLSASGSNEDQGRTGDLDLLGPLEIRGAGLEQTILDAAQIDRVLEVLPGTEVVLLQGLTIQNGLVKAGGGGIFNRGRLHLVEVRVQDNETLKDERDGGGISNFGPEAVLQVTRCQILRNQAGDDGGGIYNEGWARIQDSAILENGSGMKTQDRAAHAGAGLRNEPNGFMVVYRSLIARNLASAYGGGVHNRGAAYFKDCTISGNIADGPGRGRSGAGIFNDATTSLLHCTVAYNRAKGPGAGIYTNRGRITVRSSIVAFNSDSKDASLQKNCEGAVYTSGHNLENTNTCQFKRRDLGDRDILDPRLAPLADNGGLTPTHALLEGSPALDAATNRGCTPTDQRGQPRPSGTACDSGAHENQPAAPVNPGPN